MEEDLALLITIIFLILSWVYIPDRDDRCTDGKNHDWCFLRNSKGKTSDLGFGIKASWNINYYRCFKCNKEKEEEIY
jgi:hypothetical protein